MVPKSANPSQDAEVTTRSEIAARAGITAVACDEESHSLKRDLDSLLRDTWSGALAITPGPSRAKRQTEESRGNEDEQLLFRLVSSMKRPQYISLEPRPPPPPISREPEREDDEMQAEARRMRALSIAVEFERLGKVATSVRQVHPKPVTVETKVPLASAPFLRSLPSLLVTEEVRATKRTRSRCPQASEGCAVSPHEPRPSCIVLPVTSAPNKGGAPRKQRRKAVKQRPAPAYWRPSPDMHGKCMGYALGYPSSWAPDRAYVRDAMKWGVKSS